MVMIIMPETWPQDNNGLKLLPIIWMSRLGPHHTAAASPNHKCLWATPWRPSDVELLTCCQWCHNFTQITETLDMTAECEHKHERRTQEIKTMCDFDVIWLLLCYIVFKFSAVLLQLQFSCRNSTLHHSTLHWVTGSIILKFCKVSLCFWNSISNKIYKSRKRD